LWSNGKLAVATLQAVPTNEQIALLNKYPVKIIVAAQDNDKAGKRGASIMRQKLKGKIVKRFIFPTGTKDVNDVQPMYLVKNHETLLF
jgi:DNA primase